MIQYDILIELHIVGGLKASLIGVDLSEIPVADWFPSQTLRWQPPLGEPE